MQIELSDVRNFDTAEKVVTLGGDANTIACMAMGRKVLALCAIEPHFITERGPAKASYKLVSLDLDHEAAEGETIADEAIVGEDVEYLTDFEARPFLRAVALKGNLFEVDLV